MVCVTSQSFSPTQHGTVATFTDSSGVAGVLWSISRNLVGVIIVYTSIGTWLTASVFGRRWAAPHALPFFCTHSSFPFNFVHAYPSCLCTALQYFLTHEMQLVQQGQLGCLGLT